MGFMKEVVLSSKLPVEQQCLPLPGKEEKSPKESLITWLHQYMYLGPGSEEDRKRHHTGALLEVNPIPPPSLLSSKSPRT